MNPGRLLFMAAAVPLLSLFTFGVNPESVADSAAVSPTVPQVVDRFLAREKELVQRMRKYQPLVETYFQGTRPDHDLGSVPADDKYFLGRLDLSDDFQERFYTPESHGGFFHKVLSPVRPMFTLEISPLGFSSEIFIDRARFDRDHYWFKFLRREFLGEVRTLVFEVVPKAKVGRGLFVGRIWVEDQDYNIVRFNGKYTGDRAGDYYFHMDSWRQNMRPGLWLPSHVYSEESDLQYSTLLRGRTLRFKAQTRLWGYDLKSAGRQEEFTDMRIDTPGIDDVVSEDQTSPVTSLRTWQREAEENAVDRLEKSGLLARHGDLDKLLETVVNNLLVTNNLDIQPEIRCRVMLTTPLESFTIGHTVVVSRGLLDVLPDEASLAMVLAHEVAHIALGDQIDTKYAFADRMAIADEDSFDLFRFHRDDADEAAADVRALELLKKSPYKDKLSGVGLFLRTLQLRAAALQALTAPRLGNGLASGGKLTRMTELIAGAPELKMRDLNQIPALPLGGRIKVDPFDDRVELVKTRPVPLLSAKEKMPFEVTPMIPFLTRYASQRPEAPVAGSN